MKPRRRVLVLGAAAHAQQRDVVCTLVDVWGWAAMDGLDPGCEPHAVVLVRPMPLDVAALRLRFPDAPVIAWVRLQSPWAAQLLAAGAQRVVTDSYQLREAVHAGCARRRGPKPQRVVTA